MICTGTNTETNIRKVLEYASKIISKYVISVNTEEEERAKKLAAEKKTEEERARKLAAERKR